jgi:hypothetical protein
MGFLPDVSADLPASFCGSIAEAALTTGITQLRLYRDTEIDALVRKGLLNCDARNNLNAVKSAFYGFLDRTLDS